MHPASDIDVSILIVSFNTRELTRAAVASVAAEARTARYEIIAVDNASSDGSAEMLADHPARVRTIALSRNIGFAGGTNFAAQQARGRYLLLLNPDTVVLDGAIDRLIAFADANRAAGIWGGRTLFGDGRLNPSSCWGRMTPWNQLCRALGLTGLFKTSDLFNGEAIGSYRRDQVREVDIVSGCFLLIDAVLWRRLDGFDPAFFMYGEEADLCLRARKFGARPMVTPEATIVHYGGASEQVRADKMVRLLSAKASLIQRHWHPMTRALGLRLLEAWPASRALVTTAWGTATGDASVREAATTWRTIFARRDEWRSGYASLGESNYRGSKVLREAA